MSLPNTYTRLTYIQSSGTQYIDTGVPENTIGGLEVVFTRTGTLDYGRVFGASTATNSLELFINNTDYTSYTLRGNSTTQHISGFNSATENIFKLYDGVMYLNGSSVGTYSTLATASINLWISRGVDRCGNNKYRYFKIWNTSNELIRDFIPAKRNSDSEVGLYDLVNDVFYTNSGSGTFIAGYEIATSVNPANSGSVEVECDGNDITLTATPSSNYRFVNWTENGTILSTSNPYIFTATADKDIVANFVEVSQITTSVNPSGYGTTTGSGYYAEGETVTLNATPNQGYKFVNWTLNSVEVSTNATYTFTMGSVAQTYVANFEARDFIDCIYDRTQSDIDDKTSKAYLNISDWNRIENNLDFLSVKYNISNTALQWIYTTIPTSERIQELLTRLNTLKAKVGEAPSLPTTILNYTQVNQVEYFLYFMYDFYIHRIQIISQPICGFYNANEPNLLMAERN